MRRVTLTVALVLPLLLQAQTKVWTLADCTSYAVNHSLTIILVSHNLNLVESFATHVICINHSADIHPIGEVSTTAFANGDWLRLFHDSCPVAHGDPYSSPHDHEQCSGHHHH